MQLHYFFHESCVCPPRPPDSKFTLTDAIFLSSQKASTESTRGWDVFRNPPPKIDSGSMANQRCLEMTMQVLKVFAYLITFIIVLVSGVVAKGTLLLMTSQLREDRVIPYCNKKLGRSDALNSQI